MLTDINNTGIQLLFRTLFGSQYPGKNKEKNNRMWNEESTKYSRQKEGRTLNLTVDLNLSQNWKWEWMTRWWPEVAPPWSRVSVSITDPAPPLTTSGHQTLFVLKMGTKCESVSSNAVSFATMIVLPCFLSCFGEQIP